MKITKRMGVLYERYKHAWVFLYGLIYIPWFMYLERHVTTFYYVINSPLDNRIPFIEYFIIPYFFWFPFMCFGVMYYFFKSREKFYSLAKYLTVGMTIFLIICTVFPNGLQLRPTIFVDDNTFIDMVRALYKVDTPTNVLPSIHVYNTLVLAVVIMRDKEFKHPKMVKSLTLVVSVLIILSTMFLKQHSITDVVAAFTMAAILYPFVFAANTHKAVKLSKQHI